MLDFIGVEFGEFLAGHCPRLKAERLDTINKSRRLDNLDQLPIEAVQQRLWEPRRRLKTSPQRSKQCRMSHLCRRRHVRQQFRTRLAHDCDRVQLSSL